MTKAMAPPLAGVERGASTRAPRRGHPALTLMATVLGVMMVALDGTIVAVANPKIQVNLHVSLAGIQWVTNGYLLALAVTLITIGKFGDRFGHKKVFVTGIIGFALVSAAIGLSGITAKSISLVIAFRVVQGIFGAMLMATALCAAARDILRGQAEPRPRCLGRGDRCLHGSRPYRWRFARPAHQLGVLLLHQRDRRDRRPRHDCSVRSGDTTIASRPVVRRSRHRPLVRRALSIDLGADQGLSLTVGAAAGRWGPLLGRRCCSCCSRFASLERRCHFCRCGCSAHSRCQRARC